MQESLQEHITNSHDCGFVIPISTAGKNESNLLEEETDLVPVHKRLSCLSESMWPCLTPVTSEQNAKIRHFEEFVEHGM